MLRFGLRSVLRGDISVKTAAREYMRRLQAANNIERERMVLDELAAQPARLVSEFSDYSSSDLLEHFRTGNRPKFFAGFEQPHATARLLKTAFRPHVDEIVESARRIIGHRWPLLGIREIDFGQEINWNRDPLSARVWPSDFHADIVLWHNDGSDIRVLWELNRLGHLLTLAQAYVLTLNEEFSEEVFAQLESWRDQNPVGRGANWCCAMEVALRAMNVLAAFTLCRDSPTLTPRRLISLLAMLDQHGAHIKRNLEFSHVTTSNHYLSDLSGLLWLGIMLPELSSSEDWKQWALNELLREMDKQILTDGADYEASTGYHRLVVELFLYSFILCRTNNVDVEARYWQKLHLMLRYVLAILRPDGFAPLIGDTDGGQVLLLSRRRADDHAYLLPLGAVVLDDPSLRATGPELPIELPWLLGEEGVTAYQNLPHVKDSIRSNGFPEAGIYIQRDADLYLLFNVNGAGASGRGSHGHNDALAIEVSACGRAFIVDPGTFVYTADLHQRHIFRSTAYHSTIQVDNREQNTIVEATPFIIGSEGMPRRTRWETNPERDLAVAEHAGYTRSDGPIIHERQVVFNKRERWWLVQDVIHGAGEHQITAAFHFDFGIEVTAQETNLLVACDKASSTRLLIYSFDSLPPAELVAQFSSKHYCSKEPSIAAKWNLETKLPCMLQWAIVPVCSDEDWEQRLKIVRQANPGAG